MSRPAASPMPSQAVVTRYLKAAQAAGITVREMRVEGGSLRYIFADGTSADAEPASPLDRWRAERDG